MLIRFEVPGIPRAWQRTGERIVSAKDGRQFIHHYTKKQTAGEYGALKLFAQRAMAGQKPLTGAVEFTLLAYLPIPRSYSGRQHRKALLGLLKPIKRPDLDNYTKLKDALKGICWIDDSQITDEHLFKRYSDMPRLVIEIRAAADGAIPEVAARPVEELPAE